MFKLGFIWGALFIAIFLYVIAAGHMDLATTQNQVTFTASAPGFKFDGRARALGDLTITAIGFYGKAHVNIEDFKTGIADRDEHLQKLLEAKKFQVVDLQFEGSNEKFKGDLTLHGVTKKIEGTVQKTPLRLLFTVKLSDFGIEVPKLVLLGAPLIGDEVDIVARVEQ
jgi:polyisoprenoid-binding protein YceI